MSRYYFIGTLLPDLRIGEPSEMTFDELDQLLQENLSWKDLQQTRVLRGFYDIENLRALWKEEPLDPRSNLDENELDEALLQVENLPFYVRNFLEQYDTTQSRLQNFPILIAAYFREESKRQHGFLKELLTFERERILIQTAIRSKKLKKDLAVELQYEDPEDPFVQQLLAQKDADAFEPPEGYLDLKPLFDAYSESPLEMYKALFAYRFHKIDQMMTGSTFSIDRILAFIAKLTMVEKWQELDKEKGIKIVDKYVKEHT